MKNELDEVLAKLNARRGTWRHVCAETGIGYSWLTKFAKGRFQNPGYARIHALHSYFSKLEAGESSTHTQDDDRT